MALTPEATTSFARILAAGIVQAIFVIAFSVLFNVILFGHYNDAIAVARPSDSMFMTIALPATTLAWGIALAVAFSIFQGAIRGGVSRKGAVFGLVVFGCIAAFLEAFNYILYDFPLMAIVAGLLCYAFALILGGVAMAHIQLGQRRARQS